MAGFYTTVVSAAANTADPAGQIIALPSGFGTPTGVIITVCATTLDATATTGAAICIGGATAIDEQWAYGCAAEDAVATTSTLGAGATAHCVIIYDPVTQLVDGSATFVSFGVDEVRIAWIDYPAAAYTMSVWVCTGTTKVLAGVSGNSQTIGNTEVTTLAGVGVSKAIIMATTGQPSGGTPARLTIGFVAYDGSTITQVGLGLFMEDGNAAGQNAQHLSTTKALLPPDDGTANAAAGVSVSAIASGSFTTTKLVNDESLIFVYLAIECEGDAYADTWTLPTGTPTYTDEYSLPSGPTDFQPHSGMMLTTGLNSTEVDSDITIVRAGTFGIAMFDATAGSGHMVSIQNERNADPTDTQSFYSSKLLDIQNHSGASTLVEGDLASVDNDGFTASITDSPAAAKIYPIILFGNLTLGPTDLDATDVLPSPTVNALLTPTDLDADDEVPRPTLDVHITVSPTDLDALDVLPQPTISTDVRQSGFSNQAEVSAGKSAAADLATGAMAKAEMAHGVSEASDVGAGRVAKSEVSSGQTESSQ